MDAGRVALLEDRGVVAVGGPDARAFLQDLVTTNMDRVAEAGAGFGALLSPQGKILFDFIVIADGDGYLFDLPRGLAADFARRLGFYRLRAKVTVADLSAERQVLAGWDAPPPAGLPAAADPRLAALGWRAVLPAGAPLPAGLAPAAAADYHARRIALGVPEGGIDFAHGDAFPHDAAMDQLNGLDFRKGCYVGQEVVSRMEHRGTARRRPVQVSAAAALPPAGTPVTAGERPVGTLGSTAGTAGIALLRLDRAAAARAAGMPLLAAGVPLAAVLPGWAGYAWPAAADADEPTAAPQAG